MGQPLEKYKEVDIYENDIPAKKRDKDLKYMVSDQE